MKKPSNQDSSNETIENIKLMKSKQRKEQAYERNRNN